jgi:hypothetical protein
MRPFSPNTRFTRRFGMTSPMESCRNGPVEPLATTALSHMLFAETGTHRLVRECDVSGESSAQGGDRSRPEEHP